MKPLTRPATLPSPLRRSVLLAGASACLLAACAGCDLAAQSPVAIEGIVWQPDNATVEPRGQWQRLGARALLVQWSAVDGQAFVSGSDLPTVPRLPDWQRIAREPWAREVILGLAGRFDEAAARADLPQLIAQSARLARLSTPLKVSGWYFPVEIDPTWTEAAQLGQLLGQLPRPLWISVYDSANVGPEALAAGLLTWLPPDVGVFFQDGVGVYAREPQVALHYVQVLSQRLGPARVRIIAEAFRPQPGGGFRSATVEELSAQLQHYRGYRVWLFDGPHYVSDALVEALRRP